MKSKRKTIDKKSSWDNDSRGDRRGEIVGVRGRPRLLIRTVADQADIAASASPPPRRKRRRAADGVLFAIDIDSLLKSDRAAIRKLSADFRTQADAVVSETGYRIPAYFVFTNCDSIAGFGELFADGRTLKETPFVGEIIDERETRAAMGDTAAMRRVFAYKYQKTRRRVSDRCLCESIRTDSPEKSKLLCRLSFEFLLMEEKITAFVEFFFRDGQAAAPRFGGFFFVRGGAGAEMSCRTGVIGDGQTPAAAACQELTAVIPSVRFGVRDAVSRYRLLKLCRRISLAVLYLAVLLLFPGGAIRDALYMRSVQAELSEIFENNPSLENQYAALEKLRQSHDYLRGGLSRPGRLIFRTYGARENIKEVYAAASWRIMAGPAAARLDTYMRQKIESGEDMTAQEHLSLYHALETYLLLTGGNPPGVRVDTDSVVKVFERSLKSSLGRRYDALDEKIVAANIAAIIKFAAAGYYRPPHSSSGKTLPERHERPPEAASRALSHTSPDMALVQAARERLARSPRAETVYRALMDKLRVSQRAVPTGQLIGRGANLRYGREVSALYTREEWERTVLTAFIDASKNPFRNDWVMGEVVINMDEDKLLRDLAGLYAREVTDRWLDFIRNVVVNMPSDLSTLAHDLEKLSSRDSEIGRMLAVVCSIATRPSEGIGQIEAPASIADLKNAKNLIGETANKIGGALHGLTRDVPDPFDEARRTFGAIDTFLTGGAFEEYRRDLGELAASVRVCGERAGCAAIFARSENDPMARARQNLAAAYKNIPDAAAAVLRRVLEPPLEQTAPALARVAAAELNESWRAEVLSFYGDRLSDRYPLDGSGADAPWSDFEEFFKPNGGILRTYIDKNLADLIERTPRGWANAPRRLSVPLSINGEVIDAFNRAERITNAFFTSDGAPRRQEVTFQPLTSGSGEARLFIGDKQLEFLGGQPVTVTRRVSHSGGGGESVILRLVASDRAVEELRFTGDWNLTRLFEAARVERHSHSGGRYRVRWTMSVQNVYTAQITTVVQTNAEALFDASLTRGFKLPEKVCR